MHGFPSQIQGAGLTTVYATVYYARKQGGIVIRYALILQLEKLKLDKGFNRN